MIHPKFPHRLLYILFIGLIAFGLSMGKSLMSIGVIAISANWILEGNFKNKWQTLKERKYLPLLFLGFFLIHIIWGLFSDDPAVIFDDLRRKLPFLALPLTIGTSQKFTQKEFNSILQLFVVGLICSAGVGYYKYFTNDYENYRDLSRFVSHIRLGLFLGFGIGITSYLFSNTENKLKWGYLFILMYFLFFIKILGSGTGYIAGSLAIILAAVAIARKSKKRWIYYASLSVIPLISMLAFGKIYFEYLALTTPRDGVLEKPPKYTAQLNLYEHYPEIRIYENGYPLYMNYCPIEIEKGWNAVSTIPIDSLDKKGQLIQGTVLRYMTSKGLMKDAEGIAQLTQQDIQNIENGISSIVPPKTGLEARIQETLLEYQMFLNDMNPNGHSLVQRLYYLQAGWNLFKMHPMFGVTIGDEETVYLDYYASVESPLDLDKRLRAHNQFLSFLVCFGAVGFLIIMMLFIYPITSSKITMLSVLFLLITTIGFFADDMLNRQAGVTFVALFYSLFYLSDLSLKRDDIVTNSVN